MEGPGLRTVAVRTRSVRQDLGASIKAQARFLGFDDVGVVDPRTGEHGGFFRAWIERGYHGQMAYLARPDTMARRDDPTQTLDRVRSAVVVAHHYDPIDPDGVPHDPARAVVAGYARGRDYHLELAERLHQLLDWIRAQVPGPVEARPYVDTGPVLERELARRAGLGWFGKNTMLIHPRRGSYFFLGVLLLDLPLEPDAPFSSKHCGTCTRCIEACPTGALLGYDEAGAPVMDARRCISYLTIELKGPISHELRPAMANRVFGCDICQEVCPFNERFSGGRRAGPYSARDDLDGPALIGFTERVLAMSGKAYQRAFADSPLSRPGRRGMLRNLCVALGNWGAPQTVPVLMAALDDPQPLVRGHAAWALGRVGSAKAVEALEARRQEETDAYVLEEMRLALRAAR